MLSRPKALALNALRRDLANDYSVAIGGAEADVLYIIYQGLRKRILVCLFR